MTNTIGDWWQTRSGPHYFFAGIKKTACEQYLTRGEYAFKARSKCKVCLEYDLSRTSPSGRLIPKDKAFRNDMQSHQ